MRVVGYIRVSTSDQAELGTSLAAQRAKLSAYALAMDLEIVTIIEDVGVSAKSLDRPGLGRALTMLEHGMADGLLIAKLDRLTRSVADLGQLLDRWFARAALVSVADSIDTRSAAGRLVLNVLTSVAQWEREAIGERTRDALAHLASTGVELGRAGYGQRHTEERDPAGRRVIAKVSEERQIIGEILAMRRAGDSYRAIAAALNARGVKTARGGQWQASTVRGIELRENKRAEELRAERLASATA